MRCTIAREQIDNQPAPPMSSYVPCNQATPFIVQMYEQEGEGGLKIPTAMSHQS